MGSIQSPNGRNTLFRHGVTKGNIGKGLFRANVLSSPPNNWTLNLSDSVTSSDSLTNAVTLNKADSITASDSIVKAISLSKADSVSLTDAIVNSVQKSLSDSVTISDSLIKQIGLNKADAVTILDAVAKSLGLSKSDSIVLSDSVVKQIGLNKSDSISVSDLISKVISIVEADNISTTDLASPVLISGGGGTNYTLSLSDSVNSVDNLITQLNLGNTNPTDTSAGIGGTTGGGIAGIKWTGKDSEWETAILDSDEEILDIVNLLIQCRLL